MKGKIKSLLLTLGVSIIIYIGYLLIFLVFSGQNKDLVLSFLNREQPNPKVVVLTIDEKAMQQFGYPLPRQLYVQVLQNLNKWKPAVVGMDILFSEKSQIETDEQLAKTFQELGNIVLGYEEDPETKRPRPIYPLFNQSISASGYYTTPVSENGKVYGIFPYQVLSHQDGKIQYHESFAFQVLRKYYNYIFQKNNQTITPANQQIYTFWNKKIPLRSDLFMSLIYEPPTTFSRLDFINVYNGIPDPKVDVQDAIVLIGFTAKGIDEFNVPILNNKIPGVYIHANAINNVLKERYFGYFNRSIEMVVAFFTILIIIFSNIFYLQKKTLTWIISGSIVLLIIIGFVYYIFIQIVGFVILPNNLIGFISIVFFSFFASSIMKYINEDKKKKHLFNILAQYVSPEVAREHLEQTGIVNLKGENKRITIFFSDIAGFTTISEKLTPEDLVSFLKVYLGKMTDIILENKGSVNKYEGDAIMALWGVFGKSDKYGILDGCRSCLLQQKKLEVLNQEFVAQGKTPLKVRMGLHCGNAVIGDIGSKGGKMEFTALGDSVNLASRLEGVNKFYHTKICVSESVYEEAKDAFEFRYLDTIKVKGKNIGVKIYELLAFAGDLGSIDKERGKDFEEALSLYFERKFGEALARFILLAKSGDGPSEVYEERCLAYLANPPSPDWDGIWVMDEK